MATQTSADITAVPTLPPPAFVTAPPRMEPSPKWVRVVFGGGFIADSRAATLLWEPPHPTPTYYFPRADVRMDLLEASSHTRDSKTMGRATYWNLRSGRRSASNAAWAYEQPPAGAPDASQYLAFKWDAMDAWYEEDEEVFVHPRDPHHRVDVSLSSRHVEVVVDGEVVADTTRPRLLFETTLPVRYYIPKLDVRMELLLPSSTVTRCPYKGVASHWSLKDRGSDFEDIAWTYHLAAPECAKIVDLVAFYNERVDAIRVDDVVQPVPQTPWARRRP
jgi:uncharacterized protein (DUF427 family)